MRIVALARDGSHFALRLVDGEILLITAGEESRGRAGDVPLLADACLVGWSSLIEWSIAGSQVLVPISLLNGKRSI